VVITSTELHTHPSERTEGQQTSTLGTSHFAKITGILKNSSNEYNMQNITTTKLPISQSIIIPYPVPHTNIFNFF
jgi:hypothetical protein